MQRLKNLFRRRRRPTVNRTVSFGNRTPISRKRVSSFRHVRRQSLRTWQRYQILLGVIAILVLIFVLFVSSLFRVQVIETTRSNMSINTFEVEHMLSEYVYGKNIIFLSTGQLEAMVTKDFPQWESIEIKKSFPHTLRLSIESFEAFAQVELMRKEVDEEGHESLTEETVFINQQGSITTPEIESSTALTLTLADPIEDYISVGTQLIPEAHISKIQEASKKLLDDHDLVTKEILYFKKAMEAHINVFQFTLWFDLGQDIDMQIAKLQKVLPMVNKDRIEYFDLRINNRMIYKEKE